MITDDMKRIDPSAEPHPASTLPFHELSNVVMSPHYSASADPTYERRALEVVSSIEAVANGYEPANRVPTSRRRAARR